MTTLLWVIAILMLVVSIYGITGNAVLMIKYWLRKSRGSLIPLVAGISGCVGLLVLPVDGAKKWCWIPLLVDLGCLPMLVTYIVFLLSGKRPSA